MKRNWVLYPLLFAAYAIVAPFAFNIDQLALADGHRPFLITLGGTAVFFLLLRLLMRDWHRAGLATALFVLLFFSFGHVLRFSERYLSQIDIIIRFQILFTVWISAIILGFYLIGRVLRRDLSALTRFLNVMAAVALIWPLITIITFVVPTLNDGRPDAPSDEQTADSPPPAADYPDIYYLILDGYGRADVLQELYHLDNTPFLDALAARGFHIAPGSHSNYAQTALSLASSMNGTYLDEVAVQVGPQSQNRTPLAEMIQHSFNATFLQQQGYTIVGIPSGYAATELVDADHYLAAATNGLNPLETMILADTLPGIILMSRAILYDQHRQTVRQVFDQLAEAAALPSSGPKFVFAHVIAPHPPFVFDEVGNPVQPNRDYGIHDGVVFGTTAEEYINGYHDQLLYLNQQVLAAVDAILAQTETPPVILIQGDHGPGVSLVWESVEQTCLRERHSILNAYLVPDGMTAQLYETITPVNSFRLLFDTLFAADLGLLPDKSYFSAWERPYDFIDVTDKMESSCTAPQ